MKKEILKQKKEYFKKHSKNSWLLKLIAFSFFAGRFYDNLFAIIVAILFIGSIFLIVKD